MRIIIEIEADNKAEVKKENEQHSHDLAQASSTVAKDAGGANVDTLNSDVSAVVDYNEDMSNSKQSSQSKAMDAGSFNPDGGGDEQQVETGEKGGDDKSMTAASQFGKANAKGNDAGSAKALANGDSDTSIEQSTHVLSAADKANAIDGGGFSVGDTENVA